MLVYVGFRVEVSIFCLDQLNSTWMQLYQNRIRCQSFPVAVPMKICHLHIVDMIQKIRNDP